MKIIQLIDRLIGSITRKVTMLRHHVGFYLVDKETISKLKHLPKLTLQEKKLIKQTWPTLEISSLDYTWSRIWKKENGFSPYFIGTMWTWSILEKINPYEQVVSLQNKALCDKYLSDIPFPKVFVRSIEGVLYNKDIQPITIEEACNILANTDGFIIKPSIDTLCGNGVIKVVKENKTKDKYCKYIIETLKQSGRNFIAQELLCQHPDIARLNPTSINSCRVTTVYLNGKMSSSTMLKVGKKGVFKDNWNSSYVIGVDPNGNLKDGYDNYLNKVHQTDNGIHFSTIQLPYFDKMVTAVQNWHQQYFPQCGIIGWDVFVDSNNQVSVIEVNLTCPGIVAEQLASGLFLQPYVDEICQKLKK